MAWSLRCTLLGAALAATVLSHSATASDDKATALEEATDREGKLFFKFIVRSTTTSFSVISSTTTVPFTCISTIDTATACAGRRKRRRKRTAQNVPDKLPVASELATDVQPSIRQKEIDGEDPTPEKEDRLIITSWSTSVTTITSISTVTTFGVSVTLSVACTLGGASFLPLC